MPRKIYFVFTLIFMCFPQFATSNINEKTEDNQKTQKILSNYFSKYLLVGKANFQFLFWKMYDAKLVSENGRSSALRIVCKHCEKIIGYPSQSDNEDFYGV